MESFKNLFPKDLYHSYIVEGNPETISPLLREFLEDRGDIEKQDGDIFYQIYDSFGIEDSSKIKEWHSQKSISGGKHICIIGAKFINHDAERTLLKIIEEPASNSHFFIVVPNSQILLDTILSRTHLVKTDTVEKVSFKKNATDFYKSLPKQRIEIVEDLINTHKDDENSGGIRFSAIELINSLEKIIYEKWKIDKENTKLQFSLEELSKARDYLSLPGSSTKMILEHISLVL